MPNVLVTGANRGVGLALAGAYAARGDSVIATARKPSDADALARAHPGVRVLALDVTDAAALDRLAATLKAETLDIVICNAGIMGSRGGIADDGHDAAEWAGMMATNVTGAFLTARAALPGLMRSKAGKLAFISTMMASSALAAGGVYSYRASKAALANLGLNLSVDLKPKGIAVGIYHPGWVATDMGGGSAPVQPADSARGLVRRIDQLSLASTGVFEDYQGQPFAF